MIHVYHGDGKGKTTAAMGLALRAAGCGHRVVIVQFLKGRDTGEISVLSGLEGVTVLRGKNSSKFSFQMSPEEKRAALEAHNGNLSAAAELVQRGDCQLLVLDEAIGALDCGLLDIALVTRLVEELPDGVELVLTGRNPSPYILSVADYITEMRCERHPFEKGVAARRGVEF